MAEMDTTTSTDTGTVADPWDDKPAGEATPTPATGEEATAAAEGTEAAPETAQPEPSAEDREIAELLAETRLPRIPGETREATLLRLNKHFRSRAFSHHGELRALRETTKSELDGLKGMLTPLLQFFHQNQQAAEREAAAARIPDRETDPTGYQTWLLEENLRQAAAAREAGKTSEAEAALEAEENERLAAALEVDEYALGLMNEGLGQAGKEADPDLVDAYGFLTNMAMVSTSQLFPNATADQIREFVRLSQTLEMRTMVAAGLDPREVYKGRVAQARQFFGVAQNAGANGNGAPPPMPEATPAPQAAASPAKPVAGGAPSPPQPVGSPTARRLEAASAQQQARAAVAPAPAARAAGPSNTEIDIKQMGEDEWFNFALDHPEEAERLIQQQLGHAR